MKWSDWSTGDTNWQFGPLVPNDVLYDYAGPVIFVTKIGLLEMLFYKSSEHVDGDYFIAVETTPDIVSELKAGRLSMRGALSRPKCWIMDVDLDLEVRRFEQYSISALSNLIPVAGVSLRPEIEIAMDSIEQATSALAFKFFGDELLDGIIPLDIFKTLVNQTYDVIRRLFVPPALLASRAGDLLAFPMRPPVLASLLIAIGHPSIDENRMRRRQATKNLDARKLEEQAEEEGAKFVEDVERTVERAASGKGMNAFARDNFTLFNSIADIVPSERGDVSKLQLSSCLAGQKIFVELDRETGERIKHAYKAVRNDSVDRSGSIVGTINKSHLIILRPERGRDITCYIAPPVFNQLLERGELASGIKLKVSGSFHKRKLRDLMVVDGAPTLL